MLSQDSLHQWHARATDWCRRATHQAGQQLQRLRQRAGETQAVRVGLLGIMLVTLAVLFGRHKREP